MNICKKIIHFLFLCSLYSAGIRTVQSTAHAINIPADTSFIAKDTLIKTRPAPITFSYKNVRDYIFHNLNYPQEAIDSNIQGTVMLKFTITDTGSIDSLQITRNIHPILDAEALRLFKEMPLWKPVIYRGNPIPLTYEIPVIFELIDKTKE